MIQRIINYLHYFWYKKIIEREICIDDTHLGNYSPKYFYLPMGVTESIGTWVHEFTEDTLCRYFIENDIKPDVSLKYMFAYDYGDEWAWTFTESKVIHFVSALHTISGKYNPYSHKVEFLHPSDFVSRIHFVKKKDDKALSDF